VRTLLSSSLVLALVACNQVDVVPILDAAELSTDSPTAEHAQDAATKPDASHQAVTDASADRDAEEPRDATKAD
jgi:predicted cobalt transporter CbtA